MRHTLTYEISVTPDGASSWIATARHQNDPPIDFYVWGANEAEALDNAAAVVQEKLRAAAEANGYVVRGIRTEDRVVEGR
jgi:hypothetical protein